MAKPAPAFSDWLKELIFDRQRSQRKKIVASK